MSPKKQNAHEKRMAKIARSFGGFLMGGSNNLQEEPQSGKKPAKGTALQQQRAKGSHTPPRAYLSGSVTTSLDFIQLDPVPLLP